MLAAKTITQQSKITNSAKRTQHDRTNVIQLEWTGYVLAKQYGAADAVLMMMYGSLSALVGAYYCFSGMAAKK
jgi:hypothetical protein